MSFSEFVGDIRGLKVKERSGTKYESRSELLYRDELNIEMDRSQSKCDVLPPAPSHAIRQDTKRASEHCEIVSLRETQVRTKMKKECV
jgi:hypothetical protein